MDSGKLVSYCKEMLKFFNFREILKLEKNYRKEVASENPDAAGGTVNPKKNFEKNYSKILRLD